jgi:hypothetical protein
MQMKKYVVTLLEEEREALGALTIEGQAQIPEDPQRTDLTGV